MSSLSIFDFNELPLRVSDKAGAPWFVAADVCRILQISNPRDAVSSLDADEKGVATTDTLGGNQSLNVISESGLYALVFKSRKAQAKAFRKWVTSEVLPSLRQTGAYAVNAGNAPSDLREAVEWAVLGVRNGTVSPAQATAIFTGARLLGGLQAAVGLCADREQADMQALVERLLPTAGEVAEYQFPYIVSVAKQSGLFRHILADVPDALSQSECSRFGKLLSEKFAGQEFPLASGQTARWFTRGQKRGKSYFVEII